MAVERFPTEEGSVLLFAGAIRDPNPIYSEREYAATIEQHFEYQRPLRAGDVLSATSRLGDRPGDRGYR